jgi:hypothetical protein
MKFLNFLEQHSKQQNEETLDDAIKASAGEPFAGRDKPDTSHELKQIKKASAVTKRRAGRSKVHKLDKKFADATSGKKMKSFVHKNKSLSSVEQQDNSFIEESKTWDNFNAWKKAVLKAYPKYADKIRFNGRVENGINTVSAEVRGIDRSFGVYDFEENKGYVLGESHEIL